MVEKQSDTIRAVAWSELLPWLSILRVFRLAISARGLVLGAAGILLTTIGWCLLARAFCGDIRELSPANAVRPTAWLRPFAACPWRGATGIASDPESQTCLGSCLNAGAPATDPHTQGAAAAGSKDPTPRAGEPVEWGSDVSWWRSPMLNPWYVLSQPALASLSKTHFAVRDVACLILCGVWGVLVWSFFGTALCRTAAVRLAADEQIGWGAALRFAGRKWPACLLAPLLPIGGVVAATIPVLILGWIIRANVGLLLGGLLWPLVLVAAFVMAVLLLGALFGWPLMWSAISTEGTDTFDALSRSYAYLFQRPLRCLFYVVVAAFLGWLGWLLVLGFSEGVIYLGYWAAGWGCGNEQLKAIMTNGEGLSGAGVFGARLVHFWTSCLRLLAVGYLFSYFWTASTAIYLLLRHDVDATEMDEVFLDADAAEEAPSPPEVVAGQDDSAVANEGTP
jgi:hypothetical protein